MIEEKEVIRQAVERVMQRAEVLNRGDVLPLEVIEEAAGLRRYTEWWGRLIILLKRTMLSRRTIALWSFKEGEYRLCTKDEQTNLIVEKRQRKAKRQYRQALREATAIPASDLTGHQRIVQWFRVQQIEAQIKSLRNSMRQQDTLYRSNTLPPRPRM